MDISGMTCNQDVTLKHAMQAIQDNGKQIIFAVDNNNRVVGVLTDGDIRKILLDGYGLRDSIETHINRNFIYAHKGENIQSILDRIGGCVKLIPILDAQGIMVDYVEYNRQARIPLAQPQLSGNEYTYLMDAFLSTWISSTGKYVTKFEGDFARYCGMEYGAAVSNGTTALHLALMALGIGKGDEVIVPDLTFAATINAVIYTGATPVIVDIERDSWCISPDEIEKAVTPATKAIIPVHIYGQPCDMGRICEIALKHNIYIVEDCAEAHGAEWDGKKVGSFGIISCFSFYGNKVITTGEGGMCLTNNKEFNDKMRMLRDHGMSKERRYFHEVIGYNYRMTNLQAAIGVAQVERIHEILEWRSALEDEYRKRLKNSTRIEIQRNNLRDRKKITWLFSILVKDEKRDRLLEQLKENGVDARAFFIPLSEMELYKKYAQKCVVSKCVAKRGINLPTNCEVDEEKLDTIVRVIDEVIDE